MSLLNFGGGLSAMGSAVATYAGNAGMAQMKADLEKQQMQLADQLATTREHVGRVESGDIASAAADKRAGVEKELEGTRIASSEKIAGWNKDIEGRRLTETHRSNVANETNAAISLTTDADDNPILLDKRDGRHIQVSPNSSNIYDINNTSGGVINRVSPAASVETKPTSSSSVGGGEKSADARPGVTMPDAAPLPSAQTADDTTFQTTPQHKLVYQGDYIKQLPPEAQAKFASFTPAIQLQLGPVLSGQATPPEKGRSATDPKLKKIMRLAALIDPTFSDQTWLERNKAAVDLADTKSPGSSGGQRVAARTFLGHATDLLQAAADKKNGSMLGSAGNFLDNAYVTYAPPGAPGNSPAKKTVQNQFGISREGVAEELGKIVSGGAPTVDQRKTISDQFGEDADVSSIVGSVGKAADMMAKRINSQVDSYNMTMRTNVSLKDWLGPEAYAQYQAVTKLAEDSRNGRPTDDATVHRALGELKRNADVDAVAPPLKSSSQQPGLPPGVPSGSRYSPSRNQFLGPDGTMYDANGKEVP